VANHIVNESLRWYIKFVMCALTPVNIVHCVYIIQAGSSSRVSSLRAVEWLFAGSERSVQRIILSVWNALGGEHCTIM
jgi:hypothetical protein